MAETTQQTKSRSRRKPTAEEVRIAYLDAEHPDHQEVREAVEQLVAEHAATPPPTDKPRNVVEAIVAVMREVEWLGKTGRNNQHNYNFRGIDAAVNALGPVMRKHGLIVTPTLRTFEYGEIVVGQNRTKQAHAQVQVAYTFRHSNDEGVITDLEALVPGEAMDSGDKGTAKAMSVAFRICLLQQFALPTDEPDADHSTVTRGQAVVVPTREEVMGACQWASEQGDLTEAFDYVLRRFGDGLGQMVVPTSTGESLPGDQYVAGAREHAVARRAEAERAAQDQAAHGETRAQDEGNARAPQEAPSAQPARTEEPRAQDDARTEPPAEAAHTPQAPEEPARKPTQKQQDRANREARQKAWARAEADFQADALGKGGDLAAYCAPMLAKPGDLDSAHFGLSARFLVGQREQVISALREAGRATAADAYAYFGQAFPLDMEKVYERIEAADGPTREPVGAESRPHAFAETQD